MNKKEPKRKIDEIEFVFCSIILAIMLIASSYNVFSRYILNHALNWPDELCRFGLVWVSFISMAASVVSGNHLYVDLLTGLTDKYPKFGYAIEVFSSLVWIGVACVLCWWGAKSVARVTEMTQTLGFSMKVVYFSIPLGCVLMIIRVIQKLIIDARALRNTENKEGGVNHGI